MATELHIREADVLERQATHLIGTLGHVSEGKSTLIRALTGVKTQRHAAEQERNITIHLGYANCKVYRHRTTGALSVTPTEPVSDWTLTAHLSFVDCPGHEAYLATMLGGASIMDSACLIIAANQPTIPQPQTLEHLIAAELMGLTRMCVIQNKLDLVGVAEANATRDKIAAFTADTCAATAPIFPVAAQHGWGVDRVLEYLVSLRSPLAHRDLNAPARLTCVRSFDVNRPAQFTVDSPPLAGAVIGGTLDRGILVVGDWLEIRPGVLFRDSVSGEIVAQPVLTQIRGLRCDQTELPYAVPGSLIAIATDLDPGLATANGMVGQRVGVPGSLPPIASELVVRVRRLKRDMYTFGKYRVGDTVRICSNVMTVAGTIVGLEDKKSVRVRLTKPLCVDIGEQVSLLRMHAAAGRELLEGLGEVQALVPWATVREPMGLSSVILPARTVVWVPAETTPSPITTIPPYAELLAATMSHRYAQASSLVFRLPEPVVADINRQHHTAWINWSATVATLDAAGVGTIPYSQHALTHVLAELKTTGSVNAQGALTMPTRWTLDELRRFLNRYCITYKRCKDCHGFQTGLVKSGGAVKLRCSRCGTDSVV